MMKDDNNSTVSKQEKVLYPNSIALTAIRKLRNFKPVNGKKPMSTTEIASFCRQLSTMLNNGLNLKAALQSIVSEKKNRNFQWFIYKILNRINRGRSFSSSISEFPKIFDQFAITLILAGESRGELSKSLQEFAKHLIKNDNFMKKVRSSILFPLFFFMYTIVIVLFIVPLIVPEFKTIFSQFHWETPIFTQVILNFYENVREHFIYILFLIILAALFIAVTYTKPKRGYYFFSKMKFIAPIFGNLFAQSYFMLFCRNTAVLLSAGVSVNEVFDILTEITNNNVIKSLIIEIRKNLLDGTSICLSPKVRCYFPETVIKIIQADEEYGLLPLMLNKTAVYYEIKICNMLKSISSVIEPLVIITTGTIIMIITAALFLPIFICQI